MAKLLLILSLLAVTSLAIPINIQELQTLWSSWKTYHNKFYSQGEEEARFSIFVENYKKVIDFNSKNTNLKLGMNKFADLTSEEFKFIYAGGPRVEPQSEFQPDFYNPLENFKGELPASIDWREKNAVGPVPDQGACGACWAIASVGALQSLYYLKNGSLVVFSAQQVIVLPGARHEARDSCLRLSFTLLKAV